MKNVNGAWLPTVTSEGIYGFFGEYRFLSNFHPLTEPIIYDGFSYWTSEAAYMSGKTLDLVIREKLSELDPFEGKLAKKIGRNIKLRENWDQHKVSVMKHVLELKFSQSELKVKLQATSPKYLEETNYWKDTFWGVCNGVGNNMLGKTLMMIRDN